MTLARPISAFITATIAGISENFFDRTKGIHDFRPDLSCPIDACCDGIDCPTKEHKKHHPFAEKIYAGIKYAFIELWGDLAGWFFVGLLLAGLITVLIPGEIISKYMGGGLPSLLIMLAVGIPLYICATASTPIAAALILKGVSPGAALVFLLAGPATNITSLTVLTGLLGKRATGIYLGAIAISAVLCGLVLDEIYIYFGISAQAYLGHASEFVPRWMEWLGVVSLIVFSVKPVFKSGVQIFKKLRRSFKEDKTDPEPPIQIMENPVCNNPG
jgi:hypothetical protein